MADFLLELRCEEIPARMQGAARGELEKLFRREMEAAGVAVGELTICSTPRRLALIALGLPLETEAVREEAKGPPVGAPDQAVDGFCRKNGVTRDQLEERDVKGRATYFAVIEKPGQAVSDLLAAAIPVIIRDFSWPKSMRWGEASISSESTRWVRPLSGIVALLDGEVVPCVTEGLASGRETMGHRFHSEGPISIEDADTYAAKLREAFVIVDHEERAAIIREGAAKAAADAGLALVEDEGLVVENAGLTEWPVPLLGRFDEAFLDVPPEVIQLTARVNQKYFVCNPPRDGEGDHPQDGGGATSAQPLANAFICTANLASSDPAVVVDGNRKVLAARLSDARFFWELDQKTSLEEHAKKLERITFHEKLGTVADKVDRVAKLARWLVEEGMVKDSPLPLAGGAGGGRVSEPPHSASPTPNPSREREGNLADLAEQAARLCKADLVTEMVGEFPELQGLMGGYYAEKEGLPQEVADAIRDHYKPVGQGDEVPTAPVTVAVSLADKLDSIVEFQIQDDGPTGSKDPFALRRAALSIIRLIGENGLRLPLKKAIEVTRPLASHQFFDRAEKIPKLRPLIEVDENPALGFSIDGQTMILSWGNDRSLALDLSASEIVFAKAYMKNFFADRLYDGSIVDFFADRLKIQQREAGVRHDLIDAVFALGGEDDLVRLLARVHALQSFIETENGANLLAGYKRAANILKKEGYPPRDGEGDHPQGGGGESPQATTAPGGESPPSAAAPLPPPRNGEDGFDGMGEEDPLSLLGKPEFDEMMRSHLAPTLSYTPETAEKALIDALADAAPKAAQAVSEERFEDAMAALATLRAPIDAFFEDVTVNHDDPAKREARLNLLARFTGAVGRVADFSRIEG